MARLIGAQRMVLQAVNDLPKDVADSVTDFQIAQATQIALSDLRDWLETLEGDGHVNIVRTTLGLSASITAQGKLALRQYRPFTPSHATEVLHPSTSSPNPAGTQDSLSTLKKGQADAGPAAPRRPIRLFYSYSHKDEALRDELEEALALLKRQGYIVGWHDRRIGAGEEWKGQLDRNLEEADIILLLVSPSFLASDYCYDIETKRALERHESGEAKVIPILLRPVDWEGAPFALLQGLPIDLRPVTTWPNRDLAWTDVARGIRRLVEEMTANPR